MAMFGHHWLEDSEDDGPMVPSSWKESLEEDEPMVPSSWKEQKKDMERRTGPMANWAEENLKI